MKMRTVALVTTVLLAFGFGGAGFEREPNDESQHATRVVPRPAGDGRGAGVWGRIAPGDVDFFELWARAGDVLAVSLFARDAGEFDDPVIGIFAPGEDGPRSVNDDGGSGFLSRIAVPVDRSGRWKVAVSGFGDDAFDGSTHEEAFRYFLELALVRDVARVGEGEGRNDEPATAPRLPGLRGIRSFSIVSGRLTPGDIDYFRLPRRGGGFVSVSLFDRAGGEFNDSVVRLLDPEGEPLGEDDDSGPGFLSNLVIELSGCEHAVLAVDGFDPDPDDEAPHGEEFDYDLVLTTLGGPGAAGHRPWRMLRCKAAGKG